MPMSSHNIPAPEPRSWEAYWRLYIPKLVIAIREGYGAERFFRDATAGLTVAILALPLSMAIAIGAGVSPEKGLVTSVVAGLLISLLGGSRYQIGGPAAAFIVIVAHVIDVHGYGGLLTATFLAGLLLIAAGLLKLGTYIKYIPGPVILGFTSGIGILIGLGQVKDLFGLEGSVAADTVQRAIDLAGLMPSVNIWAALVGVGCLALIEGLRQWRPKLPGLLIAVALGSFAVWVFQLPVATIDTRFGGLPASLPAPALPDLSWGQVNAVLGSAFTIAFLIGVESLLSAAAADAMAGSRHRSNVEIVAQGVANIGSVLFSGLPATGVIARTGTNIAAGAKTPVAGILHAVFVLMFILVLAPVASYLALPCLAAVLMATAWRLMDVREIAKFMTRAPSDDRVTLFVTLMLTILVDLNVAISVGVVLASMLFMHRMAEMPGLKLGTSQVIIEDIDDLSRPPARITEADIPPHVRVFQFRGPLFFGAAQQVSDGLKELSQWPKVMILRMREVPLIDATAAAAFEELAQTCAAKGCRIVISGLHHQPREALHRLGILEEHRVVLASNIYMALDRAKDLLAAEPSA